MHTNHNDRKQHILDVAIFKTHVFLHQELVPRLFELDGQTPAYAQQKFS